MKNLMVIISVMFMVLSCKSIGIDSSNISSSDAIIGSSVSVFEEEEKVDTVGSSLQEGTVVCEYSEIGHSPIILNMYKDPENRDSSSHVLYIQEKDNQSETRKIYQDFKYNVGKTYEFGLWYVRGSVPRDNSQTLVLDSDSPTSDSIEAGAEEVQTPDPEAGKERTKVGEVVIINNGGDLMCKVVKLCSKEYSKVCSIQLSKEGGVEQLTVK